MGHQDGWMMDGGGVQWVGDRWMGGLPERKETNSFEQWLLPLSRKEMRRALTSVEVLETERNRKILGVEIRCLKNKVSEVGVMEMLRKAPGSLT